MSHAQSSLPQDVEHPGLASRGPRQLRPHRGPRGQPRAEPDGLLDVGFGDLRAEVPVVVAVRPRRAANRPGPGEPEAVVRGRAGAVGHGLAGAVGRSRSALLEAGVHAPVRRAATGAKKNVCGGCSCSSSSRTGRRCTAPWRSVTAVPRCSMTPLERGRRGRVGEKPVFQGNSSRKPIRRRAGEASSPPSPSPRTGRSDQCRERLNRVRKGLIKSMIAFVGLHNRLILLVSALWRST